MFATNNCAIRSNQNCDSIQAETVNLQHNDLRSKVGEDHDDNCHCLHCPQLTKDDPLFLWDLHHPKHPRMLQKTPPLPHLDQELASGQHCQEPGHAQLLYQRHHLLLHWLKLQKYTAEDCSERLTKLFKTALWFLTFSEVLYNLCIWQRKGSNWEKNTMCVSCCNKLYS